MLIKNGYGLHANRNIVSGFVVKRTGRLGGVRGLHGEGDGAILAAEFASRLIAMQERFRDARVADDIMAEMAGDALGSGTPDHDFLSEIDDAESDRQTFEDRAADLLIVKRGHTASVRMRTDGISAGFTRTSEA
jgi:hypothetical protein